MRDSHLIQLRICISMRTGILWILFKYNYLVVSKIKLKMIWIIDFLDFIFAEENLNIEFQTTTISKYNTTYKNGFT